ncbi:MAG: GNAT family N-acetyltransferase [Firmicutes bacterium]|nr:GNAT family N-acetyltransferase [Bacillota bacterium]
MDEKITIKVEEKVSKEDMNYLQKSFRAYNKKYVNTDVKSLKVFALDENNNVIGGVNGILVWGWLNIDKHWVDKRYRGKGLGKKLLFKIQNEALKKYITKASLQTIVKDTVPFYKKLGYEIDGILEDRPHGNNCYFLKNEFIKKRPIIKSSKFHISTNKEKEDVYYKILYKKIEKDYEECLGDIPFKLVKVFARKDNKIIGGLSGYIGWNWFYISILWVDESYRKMGLGKKILKEAEKEALDFGVDKAFLGTTEFQAKDFYQNNGYEIFCTRNNLPPGYKNFSMKKYL